jgi:hypothetical protein
VNLSSASETQIDNIDTATQKIGTITNTGGTATIGAALGDVANSSLVTRVAAVKSDTGILKKIGINKWAIVGTQLIIYDDNGSSALYTFNLDSASAPTVRTPA